MPGGDGTGPAGIGSMTGRAAGYCAGYSVPGYMNPMAGGGWGRGFGRARGGRRGWRNWFHATGMPNWAAMGIPAWGAPAQMSQQQEMEMLKQQAEHLEVSLEDIRKRMQELETGEKR